MGSAAEALDSVTRRLVRRGHGAVGLVARAVFRAFARGICFAGAVADRGALTGAGLIATGTGLQRATVGAGAAAVAATCLAVTTTLAGESAGHETRAEENANEDNFRFHVFLDFSIRTITPRVSANITDEEKIAGRVMPAVFRGVTG